MGSSNAKKRPDPLIAALEQGQSYTFTLDDGGDLASMRAVLKHGQSLTLSPVKDYQDIEVGDIVLVKWRGGNYILHLAGQIEGERFLIVNSLGKENGWVHGQAILGRVTQIIDPEPRPNVPEMLDRLARAYQKLIASLTPAETDIERLYSVVEDLKWYADRFGEERWLTIPRANRWSYEQYLWHLTREASEAARSVSPKSAVYYINHGKEHVGLVAEIWGLIEDSDGT